MLLYHIKYFDNLVDFLWNESIVFYFIHLKKYYFEKESIDTAN